MEIHARRRLVAASAAAALVVVVAVLVLGGGDDGPPADRAASLVPQGALAFVHLSTDTSRAAVRRALGLARGFPSYRSLRDTVLGRLTAPGCGIAAKDMGGREAAVAVIGGGALVLLDTGRGHGDAGEHTCGRVSARYAGRFLAIGPPALLSQVDGLAHGKGRSLADDPVFRRSQRDLPADRFADGYLTAPGLRVLLAPQAGLAGVAGALLDRPDLTGLGFAVQARDPGLRLTVHELLAAKHAPGTYRPRLLGEVPAGSLAAIDVRDLGSAVRRLGGLITGLGPVTQQRIAAALRGETVLWLTPATPAPRLTLVTAAGDVRQSELPRTFAGAPLYSAVVGDKLVASTDVSGIAAVRHGPGPLLTHTSTYRSVTAGAPSDLTSLTFLDFSELLRLAEQTGLSNSRAYRRIRSDLQRVRAVGATTTGDADQTTLQVELSIP